MKRPTPRRARAQSLTELAMMLPLIALLLIGLIEVAFLLHAHVQVSTAAREAARAASLYASTRYAAVGGANNLPSCGTVDGWSIQQTIDQAIVRRAVANNGCPTTGGTIEYSALGRLNPAKAAAGTTAPPCPTGSASGWVAGVENAEALTGDDMPVPGSQGTVTLCYPYRLLIAADMFNYYGDPIWISKSVVFRYQQ